MAYELERRYPTDPDAPYGVPNVIRTGQSETMAEIPGELLDEIAVDAEHREIIRELGLRSYVVVPLVARGKTLGAISFVTAESGRTYEKTDLELAEELARRAALAVDNARLYEEARRELEERERTEEALREIREAERGRMARELHDGVLQDLSAAAAAIEVTRIKAEGTGPEEELGQEMDDVRRAMRDLRDAVYDLRIYRHGDQTVDRLLGSLVELNRKRLPGITVDLAVEDGFFEGISESVAMELLRIVQEALTNASRHSGAENVRVELSRPGGEIRAEVSDDGRGFDLDAPPGIGLRSMQERARALGCELTVKSAPGEGTRVVLGAPETS